MRFFKWLLLFILLIGLCAGGGAFYWRYLLNTPVGLNGSKVYEVHPGDGVRVTLARLQSEGIIAEQWPLKVLSTLRPHELTGLKVGEFKLEPGMSMLQVINKLSSNDVITYTVTVPEGRTFQTMRNLFDNAPHLSHKTQGLDDQAFMEKIGHEGELPEGRFFPATYRYTKGTTDIQLYQQAYRLMSKTLEDAWSTRDEGLPYADSYQALIMASLIEQEAAVSDERARIAGVFVRRLEKGMRLQTDPTVVYGLHLVNGRGLTRSDLAKDTPYNTYRILGLPPTPIALPSKASLDAAVHPEQGNSLYFVAMGNGRHHFSTTLAEHEAAVRYYLHGRVSVETDRNGSSHTVDPVAISMSQQINGGEQEHPFNYGRVSNPGNVAAESNKPLDAGAIDVARQLIGQNKQTDISVDAMRSAKQFMGMDESVSISATAIDVAGSIAHPDNRDHQESQDDINHESMDDSRPVPVSPATDRKILQQHGCDDPDIVAITQSHSDMSSVALCMANHVTGNPPEYMANDMPISREAIAVAKRLFVLPSHSNVSPGTSSHVKEHSHETL